MTPFTSNMTAEQYRFFDYVRHNAPVDRDIYAISGKFCLDDAIRYESLQSEIKRICQQLDLPCELQRLPNFKKGHRRPEATIESLYTPPSRREVEKKFAYEIQYFGYDSPKSIV